MSGYIGNIPTPQATQTRDTFTATAGQTSFATSGYTPSFLDVFLNGVHLVNGTDYTATNGSDVVLTSGAADGDVLEVVAYSTYQVNDQNFGGDTTAVNLTVSGAFTSQGIDDNATSTAMTLDASGNVGIGTSSPICSLDVVGSADTYQRVRSTSGSNAAVTLYQNADSGTTGSDGLYVGLDGSENGYLWNYEGKPLIFGTSNAERMRIDSSGNLLVGKTSTSSNVAGHRLNPRGDIEATRSGGLVAYFNRQASDGDIAVFAKDGTTVGSIGSVIGARLRVDSNSTAGYLGIAGTDRYYWNNTELGVTSDNAYNLGAVSSRFKNLYLSGSISDGTNSATVADIISGGGKILQVVSSARTDHFTTSSTSYVNYMSATITPSSTSSKIIALFYTGVSSDSTNMFGYAGLWRGATQIALGDAVGTSQRAWIDIGSNNGATYVYRVQNLHASWIDSPSTTSATTYYVKVKRSVNGTIYFNRTSNISDQHRGSTPSSFILLEVGA